MHQTWKTVQSRLLSSSPVLWGSVGLATVFGSVIIGWVLFPYALKKMIAQRVNLQPGSTTREAWLKPPTFDFTVFMFNVTNPSEVMAGAKPSLREIGPYCFKEVKTKRYVDDDDAADTVSYRALTSWFWDRGKCGGSNLTGDELLTLPNLPLLAILLRAEKDLPPPAMALVNLALPRIFGRLDDLFVRASARALLFDGVRFRCPSSGLLTPLVCAAVRNSSLNSRALRHLGGDLYDFSFFGKKNGSVEETLYTVRRGSLDSQAVGRVASVDGEDRLPFWRGECNNLDGTDGSIFPPFRKPENGSLSVYSSEICRVVSGVYEGEFEHRGVSGLGYSVNLGDTEHNPQDLCYCPSNNLCYKKGVIDSFKCQGAPVVSSLPHFYQASADYQTGVEGLSPDGGKHGMLIVLEPMSGTPLFARKVVQLNMEVRPVRATPMTQRLRYSLTPLFWAEERLELGGSHFALLESSLLRPIGVVDILKWLAIAAGLAVCAVAVFLQVRRRRRNRVEVLRPGNEIKEDPVLPDQPGHKYLADSKNGSSFWNNNPFAIELSDQNHRKKKINNN